MGEGLSTERHEVRVFASAADVASAAARYVAERATAAVRDHGQFAMAVSGGTTPWQMFDVLRSMAPGSVPWAQVVIYQVDERVVPADDPQRNLVHLRQALRGTPAEVVAMPFVAQRYYRKPKA